MWIMLGQICRSMKLNETPNNIWPSYDILLFQYKHRKIWLCQVHRRNSYLYKRSLFIAPTTPTPPLATTDTTQTVKTYIVYKIHLAYYIWSRRSTHNFVTPLSLVIHGTGILIMVPGTVGSQGIVKQTIIPKFTVFNSHMPSKVCDEITYPFPDWSGCTVEVWGRISSFVQHFTMDVITDPCRV